MNLLNLPTPLSHKHKLIHSTYKNTNYLKTIDIFKNKFSTSFQNKIEKKNTVIIVVFTCLNNVIFNFIFRSKILLNISMSINQNIKTDS